MKISILHRLLLSCTCCAWFMQPVWSQESKTTNVIIDGKDKPKKQEKNDKQVNAEKLILDSVRVESVDQLDKVVLQLFINDPVLANWTGAYGINVAPVDASLQDQLQLKEKEGLLVIGLNDAKLAKKVDLKIHDVILGLGKSPDSTKATNVTIIRHGKPTTRVIPAATPVKQYWIGVQTAGIEEPLRNQLSLPAGKGLLLTDVIDDTPAKKAGLQAFDILLGAEQIDFTKTEDLATLVQQAEGKAFTLRIIRHAKPLTLSIIPAQRTNEVNITANANQAILERLAAASYAIQFNETYTALTPIEGTDNQMTKIQDDLTKLQATVSSLQQQLLLLSEQLKRVNVERKK
jgi:PDZ domain